MLFGAKGFEIAHSQYAGSIRFEPLELWGGSSHQSPHKMRLNPVYSENQKHVTCRIPLCFSWRLFAASTIAATVPQTSYIGDNAAIETCCPRLAAI